MCISHVLYSESNNADIPGNKTGLNLDRNTVQCRYNAVNFFTNIYKRHPIARPLGQGMGCLLWIQHRIDILPQFLQLFMQYFTILDRVGRHSSVQ